ncbi:MAG: hypothetical protein ABI615_02215 [Chthoniobacterales bacterium]
MKKLYLVLSVIISCAGCNKPLTEKTADTIPGAYFKTGRGVSLPEPMRKSLGIQVADVTEQKIIPLIKIRLQVLPGARSGVEASGWISSEEAKKIHVGQTVRLTLPDGASADGTVQRLEKAAYAALGDFEVTINTKAALTAGTPIVAVIETPSTGEVVVVPQSALMRNAEGEFVYVINENYYKRTPVDTGSRNDKFVEIKDGLYAGDQIVVAQVAPLWMTELQTLRAGQSCCKGH